MSHFDFNCVLAVLSGSISILLVSVSLYVYFWHPIFQKILRNSFNDLIIGAMVVQSCALLEKLLSCSAVLSGKMTPLLCDATGGMEQFCETFSLILLAGFYFQLLGLRCTIRCSWCTLSYEKDAFLRKYLWFFVAFLYSSMAACYSYWSLPVDEAVGSMFHQHFGWCSLLLVEVKQQFCSYYVPCALVYGAAMSSYCQLRCSIQGDQPRLSITRHGAIYVRYFGILLFLFVTQLVDGLCFTTGCINVNTRVGSLGIRSLNAILLPLAPALLSVVFLLSEHVHRAAWSMAVDTDSRKSDSGEGTVLLASSFTMVVQAFLVLEVKAEQFNPQDHEEDSDDLLS